jgi:hypothetical protein
MGGGGGDGRVNIGPHGPGICRERRSPCQDSSKETQV